MGKHKQTSPLSRANPADVPTDRPSRYEARFFEEFRVGDVFQTGEHRVTKQEIIAFAQRYDPQPYHLEEAAAKRGMFKTLVSSGFMTLGISFALFYRTGVLKHMLGGWGFDELRWKKPVYPEDLLKVELSVVSLRPSSRNLARGTVAFAYTTTNQQHQTVLTVLAHKIIATRAVQQA